MRLVADTNVLVSFFRPNPVSELISKSRLIKLDLFSPEFVFGELKQNRENILNYAKLSPKQFNKKISELKGIIRLVPEEAYCDFKREAKKLSPHDKDIPLFALALKLSSPIWSNEPAFKQQSKIMVFSNRDVIELLC